MKLRGEVGGKPQSIPTDPRMTSYKFALYNTIFLNLNPFPII